MSKVVEWFAWSRRGRRVAAYLDLLAMVGRQLFWVVAPFATAAILWRTAVSR